MTVRRAMLLHSTVCAACALLAYEASAATTTARLSAAFKPNWADQRTTLDLGFSFSVPAGSVPPPLTRVEMRYPRNLGIGLSGLGLARCGVQALEASGPRGCPPDSVMGYGVVLTGIVLGRTIVSEQAPITVLRAPSRQAAIALLFYAEGTKPVSSSVVFPGVLVSAPSPFGGQVNIGVPLVPTLPGAPYISVIRLRATIGPEKVTYFEKVSGQTLAYKPQGILLPPHCPRGGLPFSARFTFLDGTSAFAKTRVACTAHPRAHQGRRLRHAKRTYRQNRR